MCSDGPKLELASFVYVELLPFALECPLRQNGNLCAESSSAVTAPQGRKSEGQIRKEICSGGRQQEKRL